MSCTTHSEYIIDALPREGRLLVEREPDGHRVSAAPTTRQAMYSMTGTPQPELTVYVEDAFAETLVSQALPGEHRARVRIVPIGSGDRVIAQLATHRQAPLDGPAICVLDGDTTDKQLADWSNASGLSSTESCLRLPGDSPPETWVLDALLTDPHRGRASPAWPALRQAAWPPPWSSCVRRLIPTTSPATSPDSTRSPNTAPST